MRYVLIRENIQKARKILKSIDVPEDDSIFKAIKEIVGTHTGYLGLFTHLYFKENASTLGGLKILLNKLISNKHLLKDLPQQVVNYKNAEKLEDDLDELIRFNTYNKEFVSKLKGNLKKDARKDKELQDAYNHLPEESKKDLLSNFIPKVSRYKNYNDFKRDFLQFINAGYSTISETIENINETDDIYLVYNNNNIIVAEVFSKKASCEIGSKSWCISSKSNNYWEDYAGVDTGNKQYFLWNFNVPQSSVDSKVGITIKKDGSVRTAHLKNDVFVKFPKYCKKYGIPFEIFSPMNYEKDIGKIIKAVGVNPRILEILSKIGQIDKYIDQIPYEYKYIYGLLDSDEYNKKVDIKRIIYKGDGDDKLINSIFGYLNIIVSDDNLSDGNNEGSKEIIKIINSLEFIDKLTILKKFKDIKLNNDVLKLFFKNEIEKVSDIYPLSVIDNSSTWDKETDVVFVFEMSENEYSESILNLYEYSYSGLDSLDSYHNGVLDDIDDDEFNYIDRYFDKKSANKIAEYVDEVLYKNEHHPNLKEYLKSLSTYLKTGEDEKNNFYDSFNDVFETISKNIDPYFDDPYNYKSYFSDFWEKILEEASEFVDEDSTKFKNALLGEYKRFDHEWVINPDDILKSILNNFEKLKEKTSERYGILDWIKNYPNDLSDISFHFDGEYPHSSDYLMQTEAKEANKLLFDEFEEVLENSHVNYDEENLESYGEVSKILNHYFDPIHEGCDRYNCVEFYGYKKDYGSHISIIPLQEVSYTGEAKVYSIEKSILNNLLKDNHSKNSYDKFSYSKLLNYKNEKLEDLGWGVKEINVYNFSGNDNSGFDPNQLEFQFENLKTFSQFIKTIRG